MVRLLKNTEDSKSFNKTKDLTHFLAPIKVRGLVHVRGREKRNRDIVGIIIGLFLCLVTGYKNLLVKEKYI